MVLFINYNNGVYKWLQITDWIHDTVQTYEFYIEPYTRDVKCFINSDTWIQTCLVSRFLFKTVFFSVSCSPVLMLTAWVKLVPQVGATLALGPTRQTWLITDQWVSVEHSPLAGQGLILLASAFPQVMSLPNFIITLRFPLPDAKNEV